MNDQDFKELAYQLAWGAFALGVFLGAIISLAALWLGNKLAQHRNAAEHNLNCRLLFRP